MCVRLCMCAHVHLGMFIDVYYRMCVCLWTVSEGLCGVGQPFFFQARSPRRRCQVPEDLKPHLDSSRGDLPAPRRPPLEGAHLPSPVQPTHLTSGYPAHFQLRPVPLTVWQQQHGNWIINSHPRVAQNIQLQHEI